MAGVQRAGLINFSPRNRCAAAARMSLDRGRGRMRVAITFRDQPEHERRGKEYDYPSLSRREAKSLPHFIEFETPALFNHELFQQSATK